MYSRLLIIQFIILVCNIILSLFSPTEDLLPQGFPNIDMGPQLKVVERTRTANMLCAASGNPDPEITWFKDFLPIDPSTSNGRIKQLRSGKTVTFHFPAGFLKHAYFCTETCVAGLNWNLLADFTKLVHRGCCWTVKEEQVRFHGRIQVMSVLRLFICAEWFRNSLSIYLGSVRSCFSSD